MRKETRKNYQNSVRIIGGKWRGRILRFPDLTDLRPTPNRVRETLFNWLSPVIYSAHCLDLFAGSGALGFEALSRGASSATLVDHLPIIVNALQENRQLLNAENVSIIHSKIPLTAFSEEKKFTIIFLDPPFSENLIAPCCHWLETQHLLAENAYIYIEAEKTLNPIPVPAHWKLLKSKIAGQVSYHLFQVTHQKK